MTENGESLGKKSLSEELCPSEFSNVSRGEARETRVEEVSSEVVVKED